MHNTETKFSLTTIMLINIIMISEKSDFNNIDNGDLLSFEKNRKFFRDYDGLQWIRGSNNPAEFVRVCCTARVYKCRL